MRTLHSSILRPRLFSRHLNLSSTLRAMSDITLYTFGTPNGFKASVTLEELGLDYKVEKIDIMKNMQKEESFLKINPNGRIPALMDGSQRVFESGAIMLYLTDKYDKDHKISFPFGTPDYYECLSWVNWQMGGLGPMQGQANHFRLMAGARSDYAIKRYLDETKRLVGVLESVLSKSEYLVGNKYSIADIASSSWVKGLPFLDIDVAEFPGVQKWCDTIMKREEVVKGRNVPAGGRSEEEMKKMFESMKQKMDERTNEDKH